MIDNEEVYSCFEEAANLQNSTPADFRTLFVISTLQGFPILTIVYEERFKHLFLTTFSITMIQSTIIMRGMIFCAKYLEDLNHEDVGRITAEPNSMNTELGIENDRQEQLEVTM